MDYSELREIIESHEYHVSKRLEVKRLSRNTFTDGHYFYGKPDMFTTYRAKTQAELDGVMVAHYQLQSIRIRASQRELTTADLSNPNG